MIKWVNLQQLIIEAKVSHERQNMPDIAWRKKIWDIVNSTPFDITIMIFIVFEHDPNGIHIRRCSLISA
jgi:hypothetical protein